MTAESMNDYPVIRRLYARGIWKLESVAHFGGDEIGMADMSLLRNENENPFIPGTSIAGAARSFLAQQTQPWNEYRKGGETATLKRLFGGDMRQQRQPSEKNEDNMSALIVADAHCRQASTSIRDGVRVDAQLGSAATGAKFDVEVVERGTEFELNLECIIRRGDNSDALVDMFLNLLQAFQHVDIRLGARTRRGYGRGTVESWKVRDLQMDDPQDVKAWLHRDIWSCADDPLTLRPLQSDESIFLALPAHRSMNALAPPLLRSDYRRYFHIEADFTLCTSLLIRHSPADADAPDMIHLQSQGKPVIPGTSFAGAFRHRASLIASTLGWKPRKDEELDAVSDLFGPVHKQDRQNTQQKGLWASRVWIEEKLVENVETRWQHRVAIDRFTGGSLQSALFNEKPAYPLSLKDATMPNLRLSLRLEEPEQEEIGLLLLTLRDFWSGNAALGGETSNGRGTLKGIKASMQIKLSPSSDTDIWEFSRRGPEVSLKLKTPSLADIEVWEFSNKDNYMALVSGNAAFLEDCVAKAQCQPDHLPAGSRRPEKNKETFDA